MKKSIYTRIRANAFALVAVASIVFIMIVAVGIVFIRQIVLVANNTLTDAVVQGADTLLTENAENDLLLLVQSKAALIDDQLVRISKNVERMAYAATAALEDNRFSEQETMLFLQELLLINIATNDLQSHGAAYYGTQTGDFYFVDMGGLQSASSNDMRDRPWYTEAVSAGELIWTDIYEDQEGRGYSITCAMPYYYPDGKLAGVAGIGTLINSFADIVIDTQIRETGRAVLVNEHGHVVIEQDMITDTEGSLIREDLLAGENSQIRDIVVRMMRGEDGAEAVMYRGEENLIIFSNLTALPWSLALIIDKDIVTAPAKQAESLFFDLSESTRSSIDRNITMLAVAVCIFTLLLFAGTLFIARKLSLSISRPLQELSEGAKRIGEGNFDSELNIKTQDEMEVLADAFNMMVSNIKNMQLKVRNTDEEKAYIEAANSNLRAILDTIPIGIRILSLDDRTILFANRTYLDLFWCTSFEEQVKGQSPSKFMPQFQPDGKRSEDVIDELSENDKSVGEIECLRLNGEPFMCRIASCIIEYEGHRASLAALTDITAEQEYRRGLETAAKMEKEANQLKSRFLATMSHEIRTPMNAILGMSELALRSDSEDVKDEHIRSVKQSATNLLTILNDILDFSKIEAGKLTIAPEEYSVSSLLSDIVNIIRVRVADSELDFVINVDCNIPNLLLGDETRIRQSVLNLLGNAVKYTDKGHVFLGVYGEFISEDTMNLIFEISDTGIGISTEDIDKLFADFTQLESKGYRINDGVGLGLAITRNIINLMDGNISVRSKPGEGSTFTITLPQQICSHKPIAKIDGTNRRSVLIYTPDSFISETIIWTVKNLGARCDSASNDSQFEALVKDEKFDYVFITASLFDKNKQIIDELPESTVVTAIINPDETEPEGTGNILTMPVYCTQIAAVFNDTRRSKSPENDNSPQSTAHGLNKTGESSGAGAHSFFTAPDANVLIVDDIMTNLKVAEGLMAPYGMKIDLCTNGPDAIKAVRERSDTDDRYDLIFMDHKMPGMDGIEVTQHIRELGSINPYFRILPIVALTANVVEGMKEVFLSSGLNDFLPKPVDTNLLNSILEKWLPADKQIRQ